MQRDLKCQIFKQTAAGGQLDVHHINIEGNEAEGFTESQKKQRISWVSKKDLRSPTTQTTVYLHWERKDIENSCCKRNR